MACLFSFIVGLELTKKNDILLLFVVEENFPNLIFKEKEVGDESILVPINLT